MNKSKNINTSIITYLIYFVIGCHFMACNQPQEPPASSKFMTKIEAYAHAMIEQGRDQYGAEQSPLFASALNRKTLNLAEENEIGEIDGVRKNDRSLTGANLIHDEDLFHLLYALAQETGNGNFAQEADAAIRFFFEHCQSPVTGLMCWGEHLFWDFFTDDCGYGPNYDFHEATNWSLWDEAYRLAPDAAWRFNLSEWDHQINDKATGDFSRHARYTQHETFSGFDFPRYAGQMIERWADAYSRPENASRDRKEELLHYIEVLFNRMQENQKLSKSGLLIAGRAEQGDHINVVWLTNNLELTRCLEEAAPAVPAELADSMLAFALKQDIDFLNAPHKLDSVGGGFAVTLHAETGLPRTRSMNKPYTSTWSAGYGYGTHAGVANICFDRYHRLKERHPDLSDQYKALTLRVGEMYLTTSPDTSILLKPSEFAEVIALMLHCYELSQADKYLIRAEYFAQAGIDLFIDDESPLPKATNQHNHYESITGGPSFMYQRFKLEIALKK
ncbi:MAG: hypothetical protein HKN76_14875 [Saprospiraceae bacterium]|nr:hypothetical protein [Saprospiraceae bacterium]